jgi:hypothetical protein
MLCLDWRFDYSRRVNCQWWMEALAHADVAKQGLQLLHYKCPAWLHDAVECVRAVLVDAHFVVACALHIPRLWLD